MGFPHMGCSNYQDPWLKMVLSIVFGFLVLISSFGTAYGTDTDIFCLKSIKGSLEDPYNYLQSWTFNDKTEGFICKFIGVECWHPDENRVLNLNLSNMGLKGQFPRAIRNCSSLTGLDLSINKLSGTIPADISSLLTYVVTLDLSSNEFSGTIPKSLANCTYLNILKLDSNRLTGQIPGQFASLGRLKTFNVTNNLLSGRVPNFNYTKVRASYGNNRGLCGGPNLRPCQAQPSKSNTAVIAGAAA
ncbi:probably inactive leucine-rich repeat receptor-like protein kinase At5g48380 isoform X1 [Arachis hypogaea]|uniref:probably inactive leucine-rich repeat receptor-like protein kinase At5g48380 isoform X1 n=1 Tax=Arachis hypogaea TaxID=3818 RepID=UPI000DECCC5F|nr:probably inactive leucine-rich repeat receptor-like protein kinase At5g48380 isoform X1 [Arachis hypogaea]XP_025636698.1 probably inactive leucine-rich repeat receptor-like protein kinase At5g48380 isoform X1 [Arachis hypogaea]QHO51828.1 putative inactive leucine-rich repeat receptor-like protein kinase [Arachis hypogaea]